MLEHPAWHIRTAHWPTDIPLEALTALVGPDRLVECGKKWYGWRERDQVILCLTVGYGEANAWVASEDVRALDHEMARLRASLPERSPEDTRQVALRFWTWAGERTTSYRRRLDTYQWETIRDNYVGGTHAALDHVMQEFRCGRRPKPSWQRRPKAKEGNRVPNPRSTNPGPDPGPGPSCWRCSSSAPMRRCAGGSRPWCRPCLATSPPPPPTYRPSRGRSSGAGSSSRSPGGW
jgi:hypothetical protein